MSLKIIKPGLLDTIQDNGRYGFQHVGINPSGVMDSFSSALANALLGNDLPAPVLEIHFPASEILFESSALICITGADLSPVVNQKSIPVNQPVLVNKGVVLKFEKIYSGARCYLAILQGYKLEKWMGSYSTNLKAAAGGWKGRKLLKGDSLFFNYEYNFSFLLGDKDFLAMKWRAEGFNKKKENVIRFIKGNEWSWLEDRMGQSLKKNFLITTDSDRMAYRLKGEAVKVATGELISSAVTYGTMQLLPDGQMIILMADHQTTGGYPRIGHIISADLPVLAQLLPGESISFTFSDLLTAEKELKEQATYLNHLQTACRFKTDNLYATLRS